MKRLRTRMLTAMTVGMTVTVFALFVFLAAETATLDGTLAPTEEAKLVWTLPEPAVTQKPIRPTASVSPEKVPVVKLESSQITTDILDDESVEADTVVESMDESFIIPVSEEEFDMLCFVVEREVRGHSVEHKQIVTWVIVNRVRHQKFPSTVYDVLHRKNQFSTISNYYNPKYMPTEETVAAVRAVLDGTAEDISRGAVFFYAPARAKKSSADWFENDLQFLFELEGHRFFKHKQK